MMETLLVGLVVVAALACPLHMWWAHRRGRPAACATPTASDAGAPESLEELRARRMHVQAQIAELDVDARRGSEHERARR